MRRVAAAVARIDRLPLGICKRGTGKAPVALGGGKPMRFNGVWLVKGGSGRTPPTQAAKVRRLILCMLSLLALWIGGTVVAAYLAPYLSNL